MIRKRIIGATSVSTLLLLGSGCGKITEKRTEKVIEDQTGDKADFDLDSGKVKVSDGKGGTYEVDENGNVKISDGEGDTKWSRATTPTWWRPTVPTTWSPASRPRAPRPPPTSPSPRPRSDPSGDQLIGACSP